MARHTFFCIDAHTCGNPVRVVAGGGPRLEGATMSERREHFLAEFDWIRTGLMFEPRGHDMMSGSILYPPKDPASDAALLFIETSGCLPMCGHGTIGTVTVMIEHGLVHPHRPGFLRLEVPAGIVEASYVMEGGRVASVRIVNVPSFLERRGLRVEVPGIGPLTMDVAYGGNFYGIIDPQEQYRGIDELGTAAILRLSPQIRRSANAAHAFVHPENPTIRGLSHIMWTGPPRAAGAHGRNAVFYGEKAIDRSPCGTGTSARMAQWAAQGKLGPGDEFVHESIIGSIFRGRVERTLEVGGKPAIVPSIEGWAKITGFNTIVIDDDDPFARGFQVL
ncbi:MAG TPA: 4-hydroxyproline epimerase [Bacteroidota bacterium]|nr:4-hydroxyproline epimerase [Bacteroidota bacterium]